MAKISQSVYDYHVADIMLTFADVASQLAVSISTVRRLVDADYLHAVRSGARARRITAESLQAFKARGGVPAKRVAGDL